MSGPEPRQRRRSHGPGMPVEKPKDFRRSWSRLIQYMGRYKALFFVAIILAIIGTSLTLLDSDAFIKGTRFYYYDGNGQLQKLHEPVPIQNTTLNASEQGFTQGNVNCIRSMSYDSDHPTVMVPVECGASSYNYYGDYWLYRPKSDDVPY